MAQPTTRITVEFDGPVHFLKTGAPPHTWDITGATRLRQRLLLATGWRIVVIPFFEWEPLEGMAEKGSYLRRKLASDTMY
eukprot:gene1711-2371_t